MPFDNLGFQEQARDFVAPHGTDPVLETLIKAREWLSDPAHWNQGSFCRPQEAEISEASATCAWGACIRVNGGWDGGYKTGTSAAEFVGSILGSGYGQLPTFNDAPSTTHADVLALFDRAISSRRSEV